MRILHSEADVARRVDALAAEIAGAMPKDFLMAPVLTGAFVFAADLLRALHRLGCDPFVDFVQLSSYGGARASSGVVTLLKDFSVPLEGPSVLLIDYILHTT